MASNEAPLAYTMDSYQLDAARTMAPRTLDTFNLAVGGLGLAGESGEVVDLIKKVVSHGHELDREKLTEELGDVLWYVAMLCTLCAIPMSEVGLRNISKLHRRYPNGFDSERSRNRVQTEQQ